MTETRKKTTTQKPQPLGFRVKRLVSKIKASHSFFVSKSPGYVGKAVWVDKGTRYEYCHFAMNFRQKLYYPIAYFKFMRLESADWCC